MKQTSIQQNEPFNVGDDLFSIYLAEIISRGHNYFDRISLLPAVTNGLLPNDTLKLMILRIAVNPSIFTLLLTSDPMSSIEDIIYGECNEVQKRFITDFFDEITLNVRLRNPELYDRNSAVLFDQLEKTVNNQTVMDKKQKETYNHALKFFSPLLVTYHYIRKYGYTHVLKDIRAQDPNTGGA